MASVEFAWRGLRVPLDLRHRLEHGLLPLDLAGLLVERVDPPLVLGVVLRPADVAVEADLQAGVLLAADRRRDEDVVAPDDRAREAEAGDVRLPGDVRAAADVPRRSAALKPSATPAAEMPRNCGQSTPGRGAVAAISAGRSNRRREQRDGSEQEA